MRFVLTLAALHLYYGSLKADPSCYQECKSDRAPLCGVWLEKEENGIAAGTYQLNTGVVNLTCEFSSRPVPAAITWQHRPSDELGGNWNEFACSNLVSNKKCSQEVEHRVTTQCDLRTTSLYMSGKYRCQGQVPDNTKKAYSSEIIVNVVGIEKVQVSDNLLAYGQPGFVEVEVCANPRPEVAFIVNGDLIKTEQSLGKAAVSALRPLKVRSKVDGPARPVAYCHSVRLFLPEERREHCHYIYTLKDFRNPR
ncbi:unnamed protein product, partial [Mesorhabditis belari]|uniref:Ig-like domain-containing protein n=1 Tax=Mesorhabditis belari TaxID=2138241 RepID=A0AAF3F4B5_9BILA